MSAQIVKYCGFVILVRELYTPEVTDILSYRHISVSYKPEIIPI